MSIYVMEGDIYKAREICPKVLSHVKTHYPEHYFNYMFKCEYISDMYSKAQQQISAFSILQYAYAHKLI